MKILHYNLGLPPYRTGGLTKYSVDLALEQTKENEVYLLFPGKLSLITRGQRIKFYKNYQKIKVYEIFNPLPVPLLNGVKDPEYFMKKGSLEIFKNFLIELKPEVIHIHTLMGLHKEFVKAAKELGIRMVYTTHDYFGICSKVNLVDLNLKNCIDYLNGNKCCECNQYAASTIKLRLGTSSIYRKMRTDYLKPNLKKFLKKFKTKKIENEKKQKRELSKTLICNFQNSKKFRELKEYHVSILNDLDYIHYNSNISKEIFQRHDITTEGKVIFITHKDIKKPKDFKKIKSDKIRLSFLGSNHPIKGLNILLEAFKGLEEKIKDKFILNIYGVEGNSIKNIFYYGEYEYKELEDIFSNTDYTIIPSTWYETFNFVALESKIYETPVIISETIGAKDIFESNEKIELLMNKENLKKVLKELYMGEFKKINSQKKYDFENHKNQIYKKVYTVG